MTTCPAVYTRFTGQVVTCQREINHDEDHRWRNWAQPGVAGEICTWSNDDTIAARMRAAADELEAFTALYPAPDYAAHCWNHWTPERLRAEATLLDGVDDVSSASQALDDQLGNPIAQIERIQAGLRPGHNNNQEDTKNDMV